MWPHDFGQSKCLSQLWMPYQQPTARPLLTFIIAIVLDIPLLAVTARRLHDVGRSGWWMLCPILPIFWMFKDSDVGTNQWGVSPKYPD